MLFMLTMERSGEALADLADARFDELLALFCHVILGVLTQITQSGGLLYFFGQFVDKFVLERVDLVLQFFV